MGNLEVVGRTYRHLNRTREVVEILAKRGFGDLLHRVGLTHYLDIGLHGLMKHPPHFDATTRPERVRLAIEELGPIFIKAGQYLSTRADLLPEDYLRELAKLQDAAPPFDGEEAWRVVQAELGTAARRFRRFSKRPVAAASIAQVHEAELDTGEKVCVKVARPGIRRLAAVDLEIMAQLAGLAERHLEDWSWRRPSRIVAEVAHSLDREMDFALEAAHLERFARQFEGDESVRTPKVFRDLSSSGVLTLEKLAGIKANLIDTLERAGFDPRVVAERLAGHYLAMIYAHGFFHADPHPGNLLVLPGHRIGYLDFGMTGRLDRRTREAMADLVLAIVERDEGALGRALLALADYDEEPDRRAFEADVAELLDQYAYRPVGEWRLGRMLEQLFRTTSKHRVRVPAELFLMMKTLSELESLVLALDPRFDAVAAAAPFIRALHEERLRPRRLAETLLEAGRETAKLLVSAPADLRELLRQARRGRFLVEFEHKGLEPALSTLDKVSNRVAFALVLGALLIGSSLLLHAGLPPLWRGASALGLGGYLLSGLMSLWLLAAIVRHGRL